MKSAYLVLCAAAQMTVVATGCNTVTTPRDDSPSTPSVEQSIDTIEELRAYAERSGPSAVSQLLLVEMTARVCAALERGLFVNSVGGNNGSLQATWSDTDMLRMWSLRCWNGSPMFPGGEDMPMCGFSLATPTTLSCLDMIDAAITILRGLNSVDGYTFLYQNVETVDDNEEFEIWYADPEGFVWYWRWVQSVAVDVPTN